MWAPDLGGSGPAAICGVGRVDGAGPLAARSAGYLVWFLKVVTEC